MGVIKCNRNNCNNTLPNTLVEEGYICDECIQEFKWWLRYKLVMLADINVKSISSLVGFFMDTPRFYPDDETTDKIDKFFNKRKI